MKFILLLGGGRSGIDLLQSLFDQHHEVSQFPGIFLWGEFYESIKIDIFLVRSLTYFLFSRRRRHKI